jgi:histidinol-phosphate aminotransferase
MIPIPRPQVADAALWRPDWLKGDKRDPRRLWLDKNENRDPELLGLVARIVAGLDPAALFTYPDSADLYRKLGRWVGVDPRGLILAAGSDGVIRSVFEAYVAPDDPVLITVPTFAMYGVYCRMYGARAIGLAYRPSNDGPVLSSDEVIEAIQAHKPRLVCLPNPDSPTGTVYPADELRAIIAAAGEAGALVLVDEAYHPFHADTVVSAIATCPHLVVARTAAKAWGMAGLRIGYGVASPEVAAALHKVRAMYECSTVAMAAFDAMLDHAQAMQDSVARLEAGKAAFLDAMAGLGLRVLRGKGNFMHVAFGVHAEAVHAALADLCYYRRDFSEPCLKGFSRFSATTPELFAPLIDAVACAVKGRVHA